MNKAEIYKKVLREYDAEKTISDKKYKQKVSELYEKIPELKEIDDQIMKVNIAFARLSLQKKEKAEDARARYEQKNRELLEEREKILEVCNIKDDFFDDVYKCPKCKDTGYIGSEECNCLKNRLIEASYDVSNIKENLKRENFENFDISYYSETVDPKIGLSPRKRIEAILINSLEFVEKFDTEFKNLLLYGKSGLGKTFLCNCIAKALLDEGKVVLYLTSAQLFKVIEKEKFNKDEEDTDETLNMIYDADLLIIDDLGTEFQTSLTTSEFFNIINIRFIKRKPVIISTNLEPKDIKEKYSDRVLSRIYGTYEFYEFFGDDIRILKLAKG